MFILKYIVQFYDVVFPLVFCYLSYIQQDHSHASPSSTVGGHEHGPNCSHSHVRITDFVLYIRVYSFAIVCIMNGVCYIFPVGYLGNE